MARDAAESVERRGTFRVTPQNAHVDFRVPEVAGDVYPGDGDETDHARILYAFGQKGCHFFANRFRDAIRATGIVRHDSVNSFARSSARPHGAPKRAVTRRAG